jgi:hypothetical protein
VKAAVDCKGGAEAVEEMGVVEVMSEVDREEGDKDREGGCGGVEGRKRRKQETEKLVCVPVHRSKKKSDAHCPCGCP